jgi:site-specific DNA recombinase
MAKLSLAKSQGESPAICVSGYIRVSTTDQAENGLSLDVQREAITRYCQQNSLKLLNIYADPGRSGATIERPGLQQLLADAKLRPFQQIVVWRLDRWSRDLYQGLWLSKELLVHSVEVVSISEPFNGNDPLTKAMRSIVQTFAELERETIKSRLWTGRRKRLSQGQFAGGSVAYGFKLDRKTGKLAIEPKAAETVRVILALRKKGLTYKELAAQLNKGGMKSPSGKTWHPSTVHYICANKTYSGVLKYGEERPGSHDEIK